MPELPEVKTIRRIVGPQLVGRTSESVEIGSPVVTAYPEAPLFAALVTERTMRGVGRRGKYLVIELRGGDRIVNHLRMMGQLLSSPLPAEEASVG